MSDFLEFLSDAHAELDAADPCTLIINGITPANGCPATLWPLDGTVADGGGNTFRPVSSRVSVLRKYLTGLPEIGTPATANGDTYIIGAVKRDSVAVELDLEDVRSL